VIQEGQAMSETVAGFVKNGVVVPNAPLPEGAFVEVRVVSGAVQVLPELQAELDAWHRAGAKALELVERLAREGEANEKG
jgi:tRNA U34 5-methylaminomethyl-2-thiouridine-forming methyltransferase MnmC